MQTSILDTKEKRIVAGRESVEFTQSITGRVIFQNLALLEKSATHTLTGMQPNEPLEMLGGRALQAAATVQFCQRIRAWFKQLEDDGRKAQAEQ